MESILTVNQLPDLFPVINMIIGDSVNRCKICSKIQKILIKGTYSKKSYENLQTKFQMDVFFFIFIRIDLHFIQKKCKVISLRLFSYNGDPMSEPSIFLIKFRLCFIFSFQCNVMFYLWFVHLFPFSSFCDNSWIMRMMKIII